MTKPSSKPVSDRLVVTAGEPAGIGPDLCLALANSPHADRLVFVADPLQLGKRAAQLGLSVNISEYDDTSRPGAGELAVLPISLPKPDVCGKPDPENSHEILAGLRRAVDGCQSGEFAAMVTAPVQKSAILDAGIAFTGHTECIATWLADAIPIMLLVAPGMRVALATTHLPLREVPDALTTDGIEVTIGILHDDLVSKFGIESPRIVVCGLNPHAGEGGHLGSEDEEVIAPAIRAAVARGLDVVGPLPADTAFTPAAGHADAVLAMYHDQGLPVIKHAGFGNAVNVTLGLPIIRTSVDHGTALDLAGSGRADVGSLEAAIELAIELSDR